MPPRNAVRRVTARDVAERVGCSVATVSLVINGKAEGRVATGTQEEIRRAVAELGYRLNTTASALARGESNALAFVSPDPTNPFFSMVLEGLSEALDERYALTLLMPSHGSDYDRTTLRRALAGDFAGLIIASPGRELLDSFVPTCPTILLDAGGPQAGLASIDLDVASAARELSAHLVGLGHRRVAYVGVSRDKASLHHRRQVLADALRADGALLVPDDLVLGELTVSAAEEAFPAAWAAWRRAGVSAVVCGDELYAYGVLRASARLGLGVPDDLSVVGFNDLVYSSLVSPPLTSVNLSARTLGVEAATTLQRYLRTRRPPSSRTLAASLVVRGSTGPARPW
ncbi:MAG TPA: LacI family DNA-binding transcriptional regulator [Mycobacteriales bacterium]|jgi:DNA-binding LacI/PurR family transcriptional regulator